MPNDNDKKSKSGPQSDGSWIPSSRYERYTGSNPVMLEARARQERGSNKPDTQLGSSSSTSPSSSKGKR